MFSNDGSLCFENMATRFVPLQNSVFREIYGRVSQQKHAEQNLKNTESDIIMIKTIL